MIKLYFALALALLAACAAPDVDLPLTARFGVRPVIVQFSSELPDSCVLSLDQASVFFGARGATMLLEMVDPDASSQSGVPVGGVVSVMAGKLSTNVHGSTSFAHTITGNIFAAEVTLASCGPLAVAHELGHALGLEHVSAPLNLMYAGLDKGGWDLTDEQRAWIAD